MAPVRSAAPARSAGGPTVALLDVSYLFEKLPHFKAYMQQVTDDAQKAQEEVKREEQEIKRLAESAESVRGTPKFKAIEEEITRRRGDLAVKIELQRRNFQQRQAKIYLTVYKQVQDQASMVCANTAATSCCGSTASRSMPRTRRACSPTSIGPWCGTTNSATSRRSSWTLS